MPDIDAQKHKRRHGPLPRPGDEIRTLRVSVYLTPDEAAEIRRRAGGINPAAYLRFSGLALLPRQIPAINREAWSALARLCGNLNQYQAAINENRANGYPPDVLNELRNMVQALRCDLLGVNHASEGENNERA